MSSIDHIALTVRDLARSRAFYEQALAPLGIKPLMAHGESCGFGRGQKPDFWIGTGPTSYQSSGDTERITPVHVALAAGSRDEVDAFHRAALAAGARDFGPAGPRPVYHPNYYGAFVLDPDGHNIEAVFHGPA